MHILHGTWLTNRQRFAFWGEDTRAAPPASKLTQRPQRNTPPPHPFAMAANQLLQHIDRFAPTSGPDGDNFTILLPSAGKEVQPSPEAVSAGRPALKAGQALELRPWDIYAITLSPTDAFDFLTRIPSDREERRYRYLIGRDLDFWQAAVFLALHCLTANYYLPAIEQQGRRYIAYWEPCPPPDLAESLTATMPPLCRALTDRVSEAPEPGPLFDNFLRACVDTFVREERPTPYKQPWLKALTGKDNVLSGSVKENELLHEAYQKWRDPLADVRGSAFKICFRLEEPPASDGDDHEQAPPKGDWWLGYMLQAVDDKSLLVDASVVWASGGQTLTYLSRRFDKPHEKLLMALGVASRLFPPIERSLREAAPAGVRLTAEEAYRFLAEAAPMLEAAQFGVLVPNWWARRARLKATAKIAAAGDSTGLLSRDTLLKYHWEVSLGEQRISRAEFDQLVALKQPFVRYRGEWIALGADQIEAALKFFNQQAAEGEIGLLDALKLSAGVEASTGATAKQPDLIEVEGIDVEGWLQESFEKLRAPDQADTLTIPKGLNATLRHYQERGVGWLAQMRRLGLGACLADDMGLGKTIVNISLWLHERERMRVTGPALVVSPTSVVGNWHHEIARFAPSLRVHVHHGPGRLSGDDFAAAAAGVDVVLTSYPLLSRDLDTLKKVHWASVTLDEAQNIKNPATKAAQAARALNTDHRLALTGTPVENRLTELWSIFNFLNPGYLGSRETFRSRFSVPIERYRDEEAAKALRQLTAPFILRRVKTDPKVISDLPDKFENKVFVTLTPEQATLYEAVVREEMEAIESAESDMQRRGGVLRMLTRLKQICNHPAHFLKETGHTADEPGDVLAAFSGRSGKLARLTEMLEEVIETEESALIFTQYAQMGQMLQDYLAAAFSDDVLFLHGGTPAPKRGEMIAQFQAPRGPALFVLSLKAGGTGLNLTHANHVFHFDRWYNPAVENQATDRAFRIGQIKNVQVHKFICLGTLEEKIDTLIERKKELADRIVGEGEGWLSELSTAELRELVTLRREVMEL